MESCATHGLQYDPAKHDGCVLCRRLEANAAPLKSDKSPRRRWRLALVLVGVVLGIGWAMFGRSGKLHVGPKVPFRTGFCVRACAKVAEGCMERFALARERDRNQCGIRLHECLGRCVALPVAGSGDLEVIYAAGADPEWARLRERFHGPVSSLVDCTQSAGIFTLRMEIRNDGKVTGVIAIDDQRKDLECLVNAFYRLEAGGLGEGNYVVVARATMPPPRPILEDTPPERTKPSSVDELKQAVTSPAGDDGKLQDAVRGSDLGAVQALVSAGAPIDALDANGWTALIVAIDRYEPGMVTFLVEKGANVNLPSRGGSAPLDFASLSGNVGMVKALLEHGAEIDRRNPRGDTALMHAAENGKLSVAKLLIERGASLNLQCQALGATALIHAASEPYPEVVALLVEKGAALELRNTKGLTALMMAAAQGQPESLKYLIEHNAEVNAITPDSVNALDYASMPREMSEGKRARQEQCVRILLEHGADAKRVLARDATIGSSEQRIGQELIVAAAR